MMSYLLGLALLGRIYVILLYYYDVYALFYMHASFIFSVHSELLSAVAPSSYANLNHSPIKKFYGHQMEKMLM